VVCPECRRFPALSEILRVAFLETPHHKDAEPETIFLERYLCFSASPRPCVEYRNIEVTRRYLTYQWPDNEKAILPGSNPANDVRDHR